MWWDHFKSEKCYGNCGKKKWKKKKIPNINGALKELIMDI
jgi:hypothetical protein